MTELNAEGNGWSSEPPKGEQAECGPLDALLHTWSARREPSAEQLDQLQAAILDRLANEPSAGEAVGQTCVLPSRQQGPASLAHRGLAWLVGCAMLVAVSLILWTPSPVPVAKVTVKDAGNLPADYAWLRDDQLRNKAQLVAEMRSVFGSQLQWFAETNDRIELGLTKSAPSVVANGNPETLVVRVIVERRLPGTSEWQVAWAADVVAGDEKTVQLQPAAAGDNTPAALPSLSLWAYRLPDGMIFVESQLELAGKDALQSTSSALLGNNVPAEVDLLQTAHGEYRVLQTAALLQPAPS